MSLIDRVASSHGINSKPKPSLIRKDEAEPVAEVDAWEDDYARDWEDAASEPAPVAEAEAKAATLDGQSAVMSQVLAKAAAPVPSSRSKPRNAGLPAIQSREFEIDFERLKQFGFITPDGRRSRVSEEFRLIKRRLMQRMSLNARTKKKQRGREHVILVSSARPSEGKSFIAVNLALSIVLDEGFNVMLVDADVARPSISNIFGLRNDLPGLTDLLLGQEGRLSDVLLREANHPLSVLAAGGAVDSATDLFGGDDMRQLVTDIASRYTDRIIIFDAPPLLASTEPVALAEHAGQTVIVVDAERTSRAAIDSALDLLETDQNVNLVLNKTTVRNRTEQFGSYYEAYNQAST